MGSYLNKKGIDPDIGPLAISIKREKFTHEMRSPCGMTLIAPSTTGANDASKKPDFLYRFIMRTSDLITLRGSILEEHIWSKSMPSTRCGLPHKEIINFLLPDLDASCLRLADTKCNEELVDLDEKYLIKDVKVGVLLCRAGQSTEEEMYNNVESTRSFDEFLELLGDRVRLRGFENFRGGLDNVSDTTGTHSVYTQFKDKQIMFHVSTLLPYSQNDKQQVCSIFK